MMKKYIDCYRLLSVASVTLDYSLMDAMWNFSEYAFEEALTIH